MSETGAGPHVGTEGVRQRDPKSSDESALGHAGQALFRLGRVFSRSSLHQQLAARTEHGAELSHIFVVQAVEPRPGETEPEVTVGVVAERLGVDPSTASRLVAESLRAGYLARTASPADGRRARLALTDAGRTLVADARRYQRSVFERATRDWSERERQEFARLFVEFADAVAAAVAEARDRQR